MRAQRWFTSAVVAVGCLALGADRAVSAGPAPKPGASAPKPSAGSSAVRPPAMGGIGGAVRPPAMGGVGVGGGSLGGVGAPLGGVGVGKSGAPGKGSSLGGAGMVGLGGGAGFGIAGARAVRGGATPSLPGLVSGALASAPFLGGGFGISLAGFTANRGPADGSSMAGASADSSASGTSASAEEATYVLHVARSANVTANAHRSSLDRVQADQTVTVLLKPGHASAKPATYGVRLTGTVVAVDADGAEPQITLRVPARFRLSRTDADQMYVTVLAVTGAAAPTK